MVTNTGLTLTSGHISADVTLPNLCSELFASFDPTSLVLSSRIRASRMHCVLAFPEVGYLHNE